ncbi:MAG: hypothetical protein J1E31_04885 [Helicobacter sp.]|nr:hypothetical protein [Helicobacter sp.]
MQFYIYPKNQDGEDIAFNLSHIHTKDTYSFIDDSDESTSLENLAPQIVKDETSLVLIASKYRYFDLSEALEKKGITHYVDGLKFCVKKLSEYFLKTIYQKTHKNFNVGLLVTQLPHSKHFETIISALQSKEIPIVFITTDKENFEQYKREFPNEYVILARCDLLEQIDFIWVIYTSETYKRLHSNAISILCPQGLLDPVQNYFYKSKQMVDMIIGSRIRFDYIFCHTKEMQEFYQEKLAGISSENSDYKKKFIPINPGLVHPLKFIPAGYPSLDADLQNSSEIISEAKNTIILAFTIAYVNQTTKKDESGLSFDLLCELIIRLLESDYKVILRPHPEKIKAVWMQEIAKKFENYETPSGKKMFFYDTSKRMSKELMQEAFTIIGGASSVIQTFPLTTLKPSIVFIPDKNFFERIDVAPSCIAGEPAHILAHSIEEVLVSCQNIKNNLVDYHKKILRYRKESVYNLGYSGDFIASFIEKIIKKIQNTKEVLKI